MTKLIPLPDEVTSIYEAVAKLEERYKGRKFTPDGHLVGSIGEVVAAEALNLKLYNASYPGHDARDQSGNDVQIKTIGPSGKSIAMYALCDRLVVLQIKNPRHAEIIYDGPGKPVWDAAAPKAKNGQHRVRLSKLQHIATAVSQH